MLQSVYWRNTGVVGKIIQSYFFALLLLVLFIEAFE